MITVCNRVLFYLLDLGSLSLYFTTPLFLLIHLTISFPSFLCPSFSLLFHPSFSLTDLCRFLALRFFIPSLSVYFFLSFYLITSYFLPISTILHPFIYVLLFFFSFVPFSSLASFLAFSSSIFLILLFFFFCFSSSYALPLFSIIP